MQCQTVSRASGARPERFWHVVSEGCYGDSPSPGTGACCRIAYAHTLVAHLRKCVDLFIAPSRIRTPQARRFWRRTRSDHSGLVPLPKCHYCFRAASVRQLDSLLLGGSPLKRELKISLHAVRAPPTFLYHIAGEGPQKAQLEGMARSCVSPTFTSSVTFQGAALSQAIADSRFAIFPSHAFETFGKRYRRVPTRTVRPVVASDLGSRRELVEERENRAFIPSR